MLNWWLQMIARLLLRALRNVLLPRLIRWQESFLADHLFLDKGNWLFWWTPWTIPLRERTVKSWVVLRGVSIYKVWISPFQLFFLWSCTVNSAGSTVAVCASDNHAASVVLLPKCLLLVLHHFLLYIDVHKVACGFVIILGYVEHELCLCMPPLLRLFDLNVWARTLTFIFKRVYLARLWRIWLFLVAPSFFSLLVLLDKWVLKHLDHFDPLHRVFAKHLLDEVDALVWDFPESLVQLFLELIFYFVIS